MKKFFKYTFITLLVLIVVLTVTVMIFTQQTKFGKLPSGKRLERIQKSPNFKDGKFQNLSHTPDLAEGASYPKVIWEFLFGKSKRATPKDSLPSKKIDLKNLPKNQDILVWFGHSSYFIQTDGKTFLIDPVLSGAASPVKFTTRSFKGTDVYTTDDFPEIDFLLISHDHWDHLDYETVMALKPKIKHVVTGLGTGEHFEYWGFDTKIIHEGDWYEKFDFEDNFTIHITPTRHFSGRGLTRNKALWASFVIQTPTKSLYIGGDSGYDKHFAEIGAKFGGFDLVILESGQYNESWKYIHMLPHEIVKAAQDLKAKKLMPVHWGKFVLANHAWDEPILKVSEFGEHHQMPLLTPMIGEGVDFTKSQNFEAWWKKVN